MILRNVAAAAAASFSLQLKAIGNPLGTPLTHSVLSVLYVTCLTDLGLVCPFINSYNSIILLDILPFVNFFLLEFAKRGPCLCF